METPCFLPRVAYSSDELRAAVSRYPVNKIGKIREIGSILGHRTQEGRRVGIAQSGFPAMSDSRECLSGRTMNRLSRK
jgi:hypothetical protein